MDNRRTKPLTIRRQSGRAGNILKIAHTVLTVTALTLTVYILLTPVSRTPEQSSVVPPSQPELGSNVQFEHKLEDEPKYELEPTSEAFDGYPSDKLIISDERNAYADGDMVLEIPRLELVSSVMAGTDEVALEKGVGLFYYAQMPGPYNSNTSLAGHRDIFGMEFYYIDTITDGDLMYLTYQDKKYTYEYMETFITDNSNWEPIKVKDFACITLQSCTPIGTSRNRIFVVGSLINTEDVA